MTYLTHPAVSCPNCHCYVPNSLFSEYSFNISDIGQCDGNNTISSQNNQNKSITTNSNFRVIEININSLKGKKDEFKVALENYKPDCVILVETKTELNFSRDDFKVLDNYKRPKEIYFLKRFVRTESGKVDRKKTIGLISNAKKQVL